ncbi:MAG TPA: hypothetical protein VJ850_01635 [Candidatus Limnocylindrales bacterium]|nr:hypothetical protein [Candidatus Limnocylindrales bacterium]
MDSSKGFDATGVMVGMLMVAAAIAMLVDGSGSWLWATLMVVLVGGWIPLLERQAWPAPLFALVFAGIGAYAAAWSARLRR